MAAGTLVLCLIGIGHASKQREEEQREAARQQAVDRILGGDSFAVKKLKAVNHREEPFG
jgi:hypothetical protein